MVLAPVTRPGLAELVAAITAGRRSPVELVDRCLDRIEREDPTLHAFITVIGTAARRLAAAREAEARRGEVRGPLHGVPVAVKDLFDMAGLPTTAGAAVRRTHVAQTTATAVRRLEAAGAVVVGKTNLHEFAFGVTSVNPHFGAAANPHAPDRVAGGSSGGSAAAVAAGHCAAALGTDTGGSIRIPAALCGIVGLKPTFGRVSRHGVVPLAWSFDTVGPLTRTVADAALLLAVLAGADAHDPLTGRWPPPPPGLADPPTRFTVVRLRGPFFDDVESAVGEAVDRAARHLAAAGGRIVEAPIPEIEAMQVAQTTILFAEAAAYHRRAYPGRLAEYGADVRELLAAGAAIPAAAYVEAQRVQALAVRTLGRLLDGAEVCLCAAVPIPAPRIVDVDPQRSDGWRAARAPLSRFTRLFNLTGWPAVAVPAGRTREGLPVAVQLAAAPGREESLLAVAALLERAEPWPLPEV